MKRHQVVVVGAGSSGLTVAFGAAAAGVDVGLVEADRIGGDCTWRGCVPSKTLVEAARRVHEAQTAESLGITTDGVGVDFPRLMRHVHDTSAAVADDEGERELLDAGVTLYRSRARFKDPHALELDDGTVLRAKRIVLATGSVPRIPEAVRGVRHLTTDTVWDLEDLPRRLAIVGGGPTGCELGQAFRRLESEVVIVERRSRLLPGAHPDASAIVAESLAREGVDLRLGRTVTSAVDHSAGPVLALDDGSVVEASHVLVAVGKEVRLDEMNAAAVGIALTDGRPVLDDRLRTSEKHVFVCGDAAGAALTHIASSQAAGVLINLVSPVALPVDTGPPRWAVFTDPEVAQVGSTAEEAARDGTAVRVTRIPVTRSDRARIENADLGFVEAVHTRFGTILGVTIVGPGAAELANQWIPHIGRRMTDLVFTETIYPTFGSTNAIVGYEWGRALARSTLLGRFGRVVLRIRMALARTP